MFSLNSQLSSLNRLRLQPDPIGFKGDASNLYRYCGNDWANRTDPMGTEENLGVHYASDYGAKEIENAKLAGDARGETLEGVGPIWRNQVRNPIQDAFGVEVGKFIEQQIRAGNTYAQNGPAASNGTKRDAIDQIARSYNGSHEYDYVPGTGTATCSKFANDVTTKAGAPMRVKDRETGKMRPPNAEEIATQKIAGWRKTTTPHIGDVAAYPLPNGGREYSGHCGIVVSDGHGGVTTISAHHDGVYTGTSPNGRQFFDDPGTVYQTYIGN